MPVSSFQYSNNRTVTTGETWTTENRIVQTDYLDGLDKRVRVVNVEIANPNDSVRSTYFEYQRVRIKELYTNAIIFLGRIEKIEPNHQKQALNLICRDYLSEISEQYGDPANSTITASRRSEIVSTLVDDGTFGTGAGRSVTHNLQVDQSNYLERIRRLFGDSQSGFSPTFGNIEDLANEEPWVHLEPVLIWDNSASQYVDRTSESWSTSNTTAAVGDEASFPLFILSHQTTDRVYFGFDDITIPTGDNTDPEGDRVPAVIGDIDFQGLDFTLDVLGNIPTGNQTWEFWNGTTWAALTLSTTFAFNATTGSIRWNFPTSWTKRDLVGVEASNAASSEDTNFAINSTYTNKFWVRLTVSPALTDANVPVIDDIYVFPVQNHRWDYRVEDPVPSRETWRWNGTTWDNNSVASYNEGADTFSGLGTTSHRLYFGFDYPVQGIEFLLTVNGSYGALTWQHWDGAAWDALTDANTYGFAANGAARWDGTAETWAKRTLTGVEAAAPPNTNSYYWVRVSAASVTTVATIDSVKSISIAAFKFFRRGKEPWNPVANGEWALSSGHGDPQNQALTLTWRGTEGVQTKTIFRYDVGDQPIELYNRVTVRGRDHTFATVNNTTSQTNLGIVKEKVVYDFTVTTNAECRERAKAFLSQYSRPTGTNTIRRLKLLTYRFPLYRLSSRPLAVRAGDLVNINISSSGLTITNQRFLVWQIKYNEPSMLAEIILTQDLVPSIQNEFAVENVLSDLKGRVQDVQGSQYADLGRARFNERIAVSNDGNPNDNSPGVDLIWDLNDIGGENVNRVRGAFYRTSSGTNEFLTFARSEIANIGLRTDFIVLQIDITLVGGVPRGDLILNTANSVFRPSQTSPTTQDLGNSTNAWRGLFVDQHITLLPRAGAGNTAEIRFRELAANGAEYVGFKSQDSVATTVIWSLPNADGSLGQALALTGTSTLGWSQDIRTSAVPTFAALLLAGGITLAGSITFTATSSITTTAGNLTLSAVGGSNVLIGTDLLPSIDLSSKLGRASNRWTKIIMGYNP